MKKVSLVIPMYYEEEVAEECYKRVKEVLTSLENYEHEVVFVNDGSKDKTLEILEGIASKDKNIKVVSFARNFGHQCAVTAGLKEVTGDAVVIIDADLQDPPELIPDMLKLWEEGNEVIVTVYYDYYILNVTLTANDWDSVVKPKLEAAGVYDVYLLLQETQGNKPDLF